MADAQAYVEEKYMNQLDKVSILKVGHHGDITSSTDSFVDKVKPTYAVIKTGINNYGHPSYEVLRRYDRMNTMILLTDEKGTIVSTIEKNEITYQT